MVAWFDFVTHRNLHVRETCSHTVFSSRAGGTQILSFIQVVMRLAVRLLMLASCKQHTAPRIQYFLACGSRPRYRLKIESRTQGEANNVHSRASCLIRTRHCWIFHLSHIHNAFPLCFYHLVVTTYHLIHGQQDCLVVWPYKVRSHLFD